VFPCLSNFQKAFGFYFIRLGTINYMCALCFLHMYLYVLNAALVFLLFFPYYRFVYLYVCLAARHVSSNHGAKCLAHRLGLRWILCSRLLTTPACIASSIRKVSIRSVRRSLLSLNYSVILLNSVANFPSFVCAFHFSMLCIYSFVSSLPIHSKYTCFATGVECPPSSDARSLPKVAACCGMW
jgi:hypothetical protein